jgi:hypothetical protein
MTNALDLVLGALALDRGAFEALLGAGPQRPPVGGWVVFGAGLSIAIGQSVALFAVRVSPRRFGASLLVQALLFAASFLVWALSTWWVARLGFDAFAPWRDVVVAIGLAHAPQLLGAFALAPYFGQPLGALLSAWTLASAIVATSVTFGLDLRQAALCAAGGWLLSQLLQRTVGRPVVSVGRRIRNWVVGADPRDRRRMVR